MTTPLSSSHVAIVVVAARRELCKRSLAYFFRAAWPTVEPTRVLLPSVAIDAMCAAGQAWADGRIRRLAVSTCPGTSKSIFWAVIFPAWLLLRTHGQARIMVGSYSWGFATRDSARCRDLVKSEWYRGLVDGAWGVREDADHKDDWWTTATGRRLITSVEGKSTGERCTWQIIDDALSAASIFSSPDKAEAVRWVNEVLTSRLEDQRTDPRVIVGQRLCVDDPISEALRRGWTYLSLPAVLSDGEDPCVLLADDGTEVWRDPRAPGESIVELLDAGALARLALDLGPTAYAAQYLQKPHDDSTSMFQRSWLTRRWTELPELDRMVITLDASFKESRGSDYAVIQAWGSKGGDRYLVDQWRKQAGFVDTSEALIAMHERFPFAKVLVEEAANGHAIIDQLKRKIAGIVALQPSSGAGGGVKGKQGRASSVQAIVASGSVVLPAHAPWVASWLDEVCGFPGGTKNDDQVDATVYALIDLQESSTKQQWRAAAKGMARVLSRR